MKLFERGQFVHVLNEEHPLYEEVGEISSIAINGRYLVKFAGGQEMAFSQQELALWLGHEKEKKLYKAQLFQIQSLAVEMSDRQWFEEISEIIKQMEIATHK